MSAHPNAASVRENFDRFAEGDIAGLLGLFAEEAVWHIPGASRMAGDYRGREEIGALMRRTAELTRDTYRIELQWVLADDEHVAFDDFWS